MNARQLVADLESAFQWTAAAPVLAMRLSRRNASLLAFLEACGAALVGVGGYDVPRDAPHIRARAARNRKRNKAARVARRHNRG